MIEVRELSKDYGSRLAIDSLSFHAEPGEIVGFLGPNGAGKTTTMRILTGFMPPTSGQALVAGFDVVEQSLEVRRRVGYLPETVPLYEDMTVTEYLTYMAELRKLDEIDDRVMEIIEQINLPDRMGSRIASLSKGMRQRVGLGQALLHEPEVLILDEPTLGLDPGQIIDVRNLIRKLGRERTVLLSTHILSEAQQICNRVLIIHKGKIVAEDSPERLQAHIAGAQRVRLKTRGDGADLLDLVRSVPGVTQAEALSDGEIEFYTAPGQDVRPQVAQAVVRADYQLLELQSSSVSLEDIFMELTRDAPMPGPEASGLEQPLPELTELAEAEPEDGF